jgi:hypothetical protein
VVLGALVAFSIRRRITGRGPKAPTAAAGTDTSGGDEGTLDPSTAATNETAMRQPRNAEPDSEPDDAPDAAPDGEHPDNARDAAPGDEGDTARRGDVDPPAPPA